MSPAVVPLILAAFATVIGGLLAREVVRAVKTGQARGRFLTFARDEFPTLFWLTVGAQVILAVVCGWLVVRALSVGVTVVSGRKA